jgi:hypothetical protein
MKHHLTKASHAAIMIKRISLIALNVSVLLFLTNCDPSEPEPFRSGSFAFSFAEKSTHENGRTKETPTFVSYTLKKPDGSFISEKIELFAFNEGYVTSPKSLDAGHYSLEQFLILGANNNTIYASPLAGSALADLVEHPLPLTFEVNADEITQVTPEVLSTKDHTPAEFGYVVFGFQVIEKFDFDVNVTVADHTAHESIDYTLEIIAKDAPLGNVKWTKSVSLSKQGKIHVPAQYAHYTFKANKEGFIPHVQHFLSEELVGNQPLSFEFIPESLDGFLKSEKANGAVTFYYTNDQYRSKLYARIDVAEGYLVQWLRFDKNAQTKGGLPLSSTYASESSTYNRVNIFNNLPFGSAADFPLRVTLPYGNIKSMNDVNINSFMYVEYSQMGVDHLTSEFKVWKGINNQ